MPASAIPPWQQAARRLRYGSYAAIRLSDAERTEVTDLLARHYADGRLDKEELERRTDLAMHAITYADLGGLLDDLPGPGPAGPPVAPGPAAPRPGRRPRGRRGNLLLAVLVVIAAIASLHTLAFLASPWHWFGPWPVIAICAVLAICLSRRHHHHHHHDH